MTTNSTSALNYLIFSQNGVGGQTHYDQGLVVPEVAMGSTVESLHSPKDPFKKRPTNLGVTASNGYVAKSLQGSSDDSDEGSLPCTPAQHPDSETDAPAVGASNRALDNDTMELISSFLSDFTGLSKCRWNQNKALHTMKRVVEDLLTKHSCAYNGMVNRLALDNKPEDMGFVTEIAENLFSDGITNWGRIASLVAFGAALCQRLKERGKEHCVELVSQKISTYLLANQRDWLAKNNSWEGFVEFFRVSDPESTVRNTLMAFVGVAGIGATLAFLIR